MQEQAIEEVQAKIAYLERAVSELSDVALRQHKEIQALDMQITTIRRLLQAAQTEDLLPSDAGTTEERPPHY